MKINKYFGSFKDNNYNLLKKYMNKFDDELKEYYNFGKPFFKGKYETNYGEFLSNKELNDISLTPEQVFNYIAPYFENIPNYNNPGTMINVIPPVNLVAAAVTNIMSMYNPNFAQDTYAGMLIKSELEVVKYISDLVGWDYRYTHGTFTFGGKGTNLYATKIALNKADKNSSKIGCQDNYFMLTSSNGHPCHYEVCDWLGIGKDNCYEVSCDKNGMLDIESSKKIIEKNIEAGKIFLGINLTAGSTNELYVDPIKQVYDMITNVVKKYKLKYRPHIHADAVLGWVYLFFNKYDYNSNNLRISKKSLKKIHSLNEKIKELKYVDSIGIDFHKTGFCPYVSSLVLFKNKNDYFTLYEKDNVDLNEMEYGNYNPYHSTLELTRAGNGPINALCTLKSFGINGFQKIIGNLFDSTEYFRKKLIENENICVINKDTEGLATMFIIKPSEYINMELDEIIGLKIDELNYIKEFNVNYAKFVLNLAVNNKIDFCYTSSRSYMIPNTNIKLGAIKAYPMSVFFNKAIAKKISCEIDKTIYEYINTSNKKYKNCELSDDMVYRK